jgi:hypothetical protein
VHGGAGHARRRTTPAYLSRAEAAPFPVQTGGRLRTRPVHGQMPGRPIPQAKLGRRLQCASLMMRRTTLFIPRQPKIAGSPVNPDPKGLLPGSGVSTTFRDRSRSRTVRARPFAVPSWRKHVNRAKRPTLETPPVQFDCGRGIKPGQTEGQYPHGAKDEGSGTYILPRQNLAPSLRTHTEQGTHPFGWQSDSFGLCSSTCSFWMESCRRRGLGLTGSPDPTRKKLLDSHHV